MSFHRKRAALACNFCRSRKRRCDGRKPACSHCLEMQVGCHYDDLPSQRIDTSGGTNEILHRLNNVETLIKDQLDRIVALSDACKSGSHDRNDTLPGDQSSAPMPSLQRCAGDHLDSWLLDGTDAGPDLASFPPLTIPVKHKTSSSYLLSLPATKALIGECPIDLFFMLESRQALPSGLSRENLAAERPVLDLDRQQADKLLSAFFSTAHHDHPLLDEGDFRRSYANYLESRPEQSIEYALCMVVFALGAVAESGKDHNCFGTSPPGMAYMQHALPTLVTQSAWSLNCSIVLPQALVLVSVYFAYIVRPIHSWRLIYSATTILQFKLSGAGSRWNDDDSRESIIRLFWSCFLIECDRLAELELPRSGLQHLTDEIGLPSCKSLGFMQSTCYLAEISIRRLLNRIHNSLYPSKRHVPMRSSTRSPAPDEYSVEDVSSMSTICDELHAQLATWHNSIPESFRPSLVVGPPMHESNDRETVLRIRYYAARHITYRPFLLHIVTSERENIPESIIQKASVCIESCRLYVRSAARMLQRPTQYTWTFSLSSLGAIICLTLASLNPDLRHLVPDVDELQTIVIDNVRPWAFSSLDAVVTIIEGLQRKQRLISRA